MFALTCGGVGLDAATIHVGHYVTNRDNVKVPKTDAGVRTIAINPFTVERLALWKKRQAAELAKICVRQTDGTPVCCSDTGGWYRIDNFEHWWGVWRDEHGFEGLKFHELRHAQATMLLANGVDVKTVQTRLGHANAGITLDWYAHAIPGNDHAAADMLGNLFASAGTAQKEADEEKGKSRTQEAPSRLPRSEQPAKVTARWKHGAKENRPTIQTDRLACGLLVAGGGLEPPTSGL